MNTNLNIYESISEEPHSVSYNCGENYLEKHLYITTLALSDNTYYYLCGHKKILMHFCNLIF